MVNTGKRLANCYEDTWASWDSSKYGIFSRFFSISRVPYNGFIQFQMFYPSNVSRNGEKLTYRPYTGVIMAEVAIRAESIHADAYLLHWKDNLLVEIGRTYSCSYPEGRDYHHRRSHPGNGTGYTGRQRNDSWLLEKYSTLWLGGWFL